MIFFYILAAMWSIGCIVAGIVLVKAAFEDFGIIGGIATTCIGLPLLVFLALAPWLIEADFKSPDLATLKKNAWECTASHTEVTTTYVLSGNVMVPIVSPNQVCDQYSRK